MGKFSKQTATEVVWQILKRAYPRHIDEVGFYIEEKSQPIVVIPGLKVAPPYGDFQTWRKELETEKLKGIDMNRVYRVAYYSEEVGMCEF